MTQIVVARRELEKLTRKQLIEQVLFYQKWLKDIGREEQLSKELRERINESVIYQ